MDHLPRCTNLKCELFDSSTMKLKNFKENLFQEFSTKWDSTFNENQRPVTNCTGLVSSQTSQIGRKSKNRSVYGQPQISLDTTNTMQHSSHWKSLDSLEYCESSHSFESNSTSFSDLRTLDCQNHHKTQDLIVSDLGTSVESFENEQESFKRCPSVNSSSSGCSVTDIRDVDNEAKNFMKQFVEKIFDNSSMITLEEKAKFGYYSRVEAGRIWFARYINKKRNENKCVRESTFYSLAQYFAIILFECADSDDFTPAKVLMNMCFTYYYHQQHSTKPPTSWSRQTSVENGSSNKQYLYSVLRDQPIWKLVRFWNAAFFDAVQCEREKFYENRHNKQETNNTNVQPNHRFYDWQFHANLTFGQLGTFTYNMYSFGLTKQFCLDFLRKQSTIANLTQEQIQILTDNIETMYTKQNND